LKESIRPSVGAPLGYSASHSLQHQFQLSIGRCVCVSTVQWQVVDSAVFSVERKRVVCYIPLASLTSVEDDRMLVASRRRRPVPLIFGRQMRAFSVPTRPLGSSRTTPKRVSRPLMSLCGRSPRPIHLLGSSFLPAGMRSSPVPGAARPSVSATILHTRYCCGRTRPSSRLVPPSFVLFLWSCTSPPT